MDTLGDLIHHVRQFVAEKGYEKAACDFANELTWFWKKYPKEYEAFWHQGKVPAEKSFDTVVDKMGLLVDAIFSPKLFNFYEGILPLVEQFMATTTCPALEQLAGDTIDAIEDWWDYFIDRGYVDNAKLVSKDSMLQLLKLVRKDFHFREDHECSTWISCGFRTEKLHASLDRKIRKLKDQVKRCEDGHPDKPVISSDSLSTLLLKLEYFMKSKEYNMQAGNLATYGTTLYKTQRAEYINGWLNCQMDQNELLSDTFVAELAPIVQDLINRLCPDYVIEFHQTAHETVQEMMRTHCCNGSPFGDPLFMVQQINVGIEYWSNFFRDRAYGFTLLSGKPFVVSRENLCQLLKNIIRDFRLTHDEDNVWSSSGIDTKPYFNLDLVKNLKKFVDWCSNKQC